MEFPFFDFLEGLSPWWWVALGIGLGAVEMATMSFFLLWPGLAALAMAAILSVFPGMSGELQIASFAILAVALTFLGRGLIGRYGDGGAAATTINDRSAQLVGREARVLSRAGHTARIEIDGIHWQAAIDDGASLPETGDMVKVVSAAEGVLTIRAGA